MASETGPAPHLLALYRALADEPFRFGFFTALRRIEALHPERPRIGEALRAADDPVRLGQEPSLTFAPATLAAFEARASRAPLLHVFFLGLFGPNGPLPIHLTEYARERLRNADDPTFARFADVFHHRILSLFYRAWALNQPNVDYDRPEHSRSASHVGALLGIGRPAFRDRDAIPHAAKLHYAGHLACQARHPEGLAAMISDFLGVTTAIAEFIGEWIAIPASGICRLGLARDTSTLGMNMIIGERVWTGQQKFRIRLGPLTYRDYLRLLPGGLSLRRLVALVRNYLSDELNWEANLVLRKEDVPAPRLGEYVQLGWTTWLCAAPPGHDRDDLRLNPLVFE
jgi:type VI secretion system protein ImpH